jgi:xylulokinase
MKYLLGVDFGGSSSKATLLREDGAVVATASKEYSTYYPQNGWAEQDPDDSYHALIGNIRELLETTQIKPEDVAALALDAATHTAVLLGADDRPVRRAIYWTDARAGEEAAALKAGMGGEIMRECYNSVSSLWTLPQLMWLKKHEPDAVRKVKKVLAVKDYVRYRLTGDYVTDSIEAMGFLLLDVKRNVWSKTLCELAGLNPEIMPPLVEPTRIVSPLTKQAQIDTGLTAKTAVIAGATDTSMEVYAAGAVRVGQATVKLATAGRICSVTDHEVVDPRLVTYRHVVKGLWYPGTATKSCAAANRWYRDTFGGEFGEMSEKAASVERGCEGLIFHPYLQGEITPYLDDKLRASFTGVAGFHTKAHFNRAVLEGVAYSMKDCYETLKEMGIAPKTAVGIGGGMKSALWRQIMADMLNIPLTTVQYVDSSLGSAMLAGVAVGAFSSHGDAVKRCVREAGVTVPDPQGVSYYGERFKLYKEITDALAPIYHKL